MESQFIMNLAEVSNRSLPIINKFINSTFSNAEQTSFKLSISYFSFTGNTTPNYYQPLRPHEHQLCQEDRTKTNVIHRLHEKVHGTNIDEIQSRACINGEIVVQLNLIEYTCIAHVHLMYLDEVIWRTQLLV